MVASLDLSRIRVRGAQLAAMQLNMEDTLTGSTRLVLLKKLVTSQLTMVDQF